MINLFDVKYIISILALIFIIAIVISYIYTSKEFAESKYYIFFRILEGIALVLVAYGLILTAISAREEQNLNFINTTYLVIDRCKLNILNKINISYPICPNFIASLNLLYDIPGNNNIQDKEIDIYNLSNNLLQAIEDVITGDKFDLTQVNSWISFYMPWCCSDTFYIMWKKIMESFNNITNGLVYILFEYANKNGKIYNVTQLNKKVNDFNNDSRVINIYNKL
jgi:hypothetical protein